MANPNPDTSLENPHQSSTTHSPTKAVQNETTLIQPPPLPDASRSQLRTSLLVPPPVRDSYLLEPSSLSDRISENFLLTISLLLSTLFWLIILISQSYVTSTLSNIFIRTGWFGFVIQTFFILLTTYYLFFTTYLPPYHIQLSTLASLSIVFGAITIDQNLSIGLGQTGGVSSAQNAVAAAWFLTVFLNLFWVFYFTSPPGAPLVSFVHSIRPASRGAAGTSSTPKQPPVGGGFEAGQAPQIEMAPVSATIRSGGSNSSRLNPSASHLGSGVGVGNNPNPSGGALTPHQHIQARLSGISALSSEGGGGGGGTNTPKRRSGWSFYGRDKDRNGEKEKGNGEGPSGVGSEGGHAVHEGGGGKLTKGASVKGKHPGGGVSSPVAPPAPIPTPAQEAELGLEGLRKAEAIFTYTAAAADPNELSFRKGDILYIVDHSGKWWDAKRADGKGGIVPSNYLRFIE